MSESGSLDGEVLDVDDTVVVPVGDGRKVRRGVRRVSSAGLEVVRDAVSVQVGVRVGVAERWVSPWVMSSLEGILGGDDNLRGSGWRSGVTASGGWHVDWG